MREENPHEMTTGELLFSWGVVLFGCLLYLN